MGIATDLAEETINKFKAAVILEGLKGEDRMQRLQDLFEAALDRAMQIGAQGALKQQRDHAA